MSGFRPMVLVSMAGEHSGFPGSALNSLPLFPCFLVVSETVVFPFILNGKGHARFKKKSSSSSTPVKLKWHRNCSFHRVRRHSSRSISINISQLRTSDWNKGIYEVGVTTRSWCFSCQTRTHACGSSLLWNSPVWITATIGPNILPVLIFCRYSRSFKRYTRTVMSDLSTVFCPGSVLSVISGHFGLHVKVVIISGEACIRKTATPS